MSTCPETAVLDPAMLAQLDAVGAKLRTDPQHWPRCDFDIDHAGDHWSVARHCYNEPGRAGDLWLRWSTADLPTLVEHPPCESTPSGEEDDATYCFLPEHHPGLHDDGDLCW